MKVSLETVADGVLSPPGAWQRITIGSLLCFVPVVNILALGYLALFLHRFRSSGQPVLPPWEAWDRLLLSGLRTLLVFALTFLLPFALAGLLSWLVTLLSLGLLDFVSYCFFSLAMLVAPLLFALGLYRFQETGDLRSLLDFELLRVGRRILPASLVPTCAFWGLQAIGLPLYGFAHFIGAVLLMAYFYVLLARQPAKR